MLAFLSKLSKVHLSPFPKFWMFSACFVEYEIRSVLDLKHVNNNMI